MLLVRTKTFWTGLAAVVAAAGAFFTGQADLAQAAQMAFTGLTAMFLRHGLVKLGGGPR
jgi:hypothetical protein